MLSGSTCPCLDGDHQGAPSFVFIGTNYLTRLTLSNSNGELHEQLNDTRSRIHRAGELYKAFYVLFPFYLGSLLPPNYSGLAEAAAPLALTLAMKATFALSTFSSLPSQAARQLS